MPTLQQNIEQSITDNKKLRDYTILSYLKEYKKSFKAFPTVGQLNWFIFEHEGLRIDEDYIQTVINQL